MSLVSEEKTKGLVAIKLSNITGYPTQQNINIDGITWFKEDSYKGTSYDWLKDVFNKATKKQTLVSKGTPDFIVTKDGSEIIIVVECKGDKEHHSAINNLDEYKMKGYGTGEETQKYAVNGALWYASFLCDKYDVIAIGVSGQNEVECKVSSFVWPKGGSISDIMLLEDGSLTDSFMSINQYIKDADKVLGRFVATETEVKRELRRYTLSCANFLRSNGIEDDSKAGFVSAVILGLTNQESRLFKETKKSIEEKRRTKSKRVIDTIGKNSVKLLKASLYGEGDEFEPDYVKGIWDIDQIPKGKRTSLKKFYDNMLSKDELLRAPKGGDKDFPYGETVLSRCIFSLYENVIEVLQKYTGIDVMGEFYTTFLHFTKGNAKEKGIVLTPKHVTELFCDLAEYYLGQKFNENTKIIDICCGTGAFLIAALAKIKLNIEAEKIGEDKKQEKYEYAQKHSLIGVERDSSMYALAYANMRFHGDGKSNLFNCSSLLIDAYAPIDDSGKTYLKSDSKIPLNEALSSFGDIDVALINPPYSLDKKDSTIREYEIIQRKNEIEDKLKQCNRDLKRINKDFGERSPQARKLLKDIDKYEEKLQIIFKALEASKMEEVVISKGQSELDFIAAMLHYLKEGGIGIAIVPMSCAGNNGTWLRSAILKHHTLLACVTMPQNLFFDSHVGTSTCIMIFKAHVKHDENKSVFFARWKDDGFKVIPHNGRKDSGEWETIKKSWIEQIDGTAKADEYSWLRKKIKITDEALAEAYIKTDYSKLNDADFEIVLKKYALFKHMEQSGLLEE